MPHTAVVPYLTSDVLVNRICGDMFDEISRDAKEHKILTEDDLQFRVYSFIRGVIEEMEERSTGEYQRKYSGDWRVFNKPYLQGVKKYPDLMIVNGKFAKIIIELKHHPMRSVSVEDIEADILKIKRILDSSDVVEHGIVIATIWDPNGELCKSLTRFQSENGHDKSRLFPIEISRNIDIQDHDIWKSEHANMLGAIRSFQYE